MANWLQQVTAIVHPHNTVRDITWVSDQSEHLAKCGHVYIFQIGVQWGMLLGWVPMACTCAVEDIAFAQNSKSCAGIIHCCASGQWHLCTIHAVYYLDTLRMSVPA